LRPGSRSLVWITVSRKRAAKQTSAQEEAPECSKLRGLAPRNSLVKGLSGSIIAVTAVSAPATEAPIDAYQELVEVTLDVCCRATPQVVKHHGRILWSNVVPLYE
jgi:hypothetical protein